MMGETKLVTIKEEVGKAFRRSRTKISKWLQQQLRKLEREPAPNPRELETLIIFQKMLEEAVNRQKRPRKKSAAKRRKRPAGTARK